MISGVSDTEGMIVKTTDKISIITITILRDPHTSSITIKFQTIRFQTMRDIIDNSTIHKHETTAEMLIKRIDRRTENPGRKAGIAEEMTTTIEDLRGADNRPGTESVKYRDTYTTIRHAGDEINSKVGAGERIPQEGDRIDRERSIINDQLVQSLTGSKQHHDCGEERGV